MEARSALRRLFFFTFLFAILSTVHCDIRCHCNQPACVRTGYMCKSTGPQAACFVEHSNFVNAGRSNSDISRHGCIEMLPIGQRTPCLNQALDAFALQNAGYAVPQKAGAGGHHNHRYLVEGGGGGGRHHGHRSADHHQQKSTTCCLDDMCNYVKTNIREEEVVVDTVRGDPKVESAVNPSNLWNSGRAGSSPPTANNIDSLGKHFEESYRDPNKHDSTLWFEVLTFGIIMVLLAVLVLLILFGVRFIRQGDCQHQKSSQSNLPQTRLPNTYGYDLGDDCSGGSGKRSMLDQWKCFKSVTSANAHQLMGNSGSNRAGAGGGTSASSLLYGGSKPSTGSLLYNNQANGKTKQSLLFSVKVDLDSSSQQCPPSMTATKLTAGSDVDDLSSETGSQLAVAAPTSNLPNIICAHTLPPEKVMADEMQLAESNRSSMNRAAGFGRERQNSIYLSLLPPPTTSTSVIQPPSTHFDLISSANN